MIVLGVVGQIPIGSDVAHAGTMEADPASSNDSNLRIAR
jgi:hypothetical protein